MTLIGGSYLVNAQFAPGAFVVETIHVFPEKISAPGWRNIETVTFQNLDEYAMSQDFNDTNSASLRSGNLVAKELKNLNVEAGKVSSNSPSEVQEGEDSEVIFDIEENLIPGENNLPELSVTSTEQDFEVDTQIPAEPVSDEEVEAEEQPEVFSSATTTVLRKTKSLFALAVGAVIDNFDSNSSEAVAEEVESVPELNIEDSLQTEDEVANDGEVSESESSEAPADETSTEVTTSKNEIPEVENFDNCSDDCLPYIISLSDFGYPLDSNVEISGAQLRLSFYALKKKNQDRTPQFLINYSLDGGSIWQSAGVVIIEDEEVSNSVNGGYFLFALPDLTTQEDLNNLKVELVYKDNPKIVEDLYVESVWLELFTVKPPEVAERIDVAALLADDGYDETPFSGDELVLPDGEKITFEFTDDNTDETLIIKSSKKSYQGLTKTKTYFSVTNTSDGEDEFSLQTYFPQNVGEVTSLREFTKNVPRKEIIPEYRPYVYNCEAGWEFEGKNFFDTIEELSKTFSDSDLSAEEEITPEDTSDFEFPTTLTEEEEVPEEVIPEVIEDASTTTVSFNLPDARALAQFTSVVDRLIPETEEAISEENNDSTEEEITNSYLCKNTNTSRTCDSVEGGGTACVVNDVKVAEYDVVRYKPGWIERVHKEGSLPKPGIVKRVTDFFGFGPDKKDVPDEFEPRVHSNEKYVILPGETKYFEMQIKFPQFSTGEYWIEAVGNDEYGLLDPFWSSTWAYKMPVTIDNTSGASNLTEQQVFLEFDSSMTDFWSNVASDGADIRFIQEFNDGSNEDSWLAIAWDKRLPLTIQSSEVASTMTDFPVYVDLSTLGADFWSNVQATGADIRITTGDGKTEVPYELVSINTATRVGELYFKADSISSSVDTTFYVYYKNPEAVAYAIDNPLGAESVWDDDYEGVYHLVQTSSGTSGEYIDSTSNDNDGTGEDTLPTRVTGRFGFGQSFPQAGKIDLGNAFSGTMNTNQAYTLSAWINQNSSANDQGIVSQYAAAGDILWWADTAGGAQGFCNYNGAYMPSDCQDTAGQNPGTWQYVVAGYGSGQGYMVLNGTQTGAGRTIAIWGIDLALPWAIGAANGNVTGAQSGTTRWFNGLMDEVRISSIDRGDDWIQSEYSNMNTPATFYATSTPEVFTTGYFLELDHWVQHFDNAADEADIWVQVQDMPASASTTIYLYYGNAEATSESDELAPFTYSTSTDIYYVLDDDSTGPIEVYSYIDGNLVSLDGGIPVALNAGETTSFTGYNGNSVISSLGPIAATVDNADADTIAPISFATTTHVSPTNRQANEWFFVAPFADSSVSTYIGGSGTADLTGTVVTSAASTFTSDPGGTDGLVIESDNPILAFHQAVGGQQDSYVLYPPTLRDIFGIRSNTAYISTVTANPDPTVYCSDSSTATVSGITRGEQQAVATCANGADGQGNAMRYTGQAYPIVAIQQADGDGGEATAFWPQHEFATEYYLPTDTAYVAVVCSPRFGAATVEVQTNDGVTTLDTDTCSPASASDPGKAYLDSGLGGDSLAFSAGSKVVSTNGVPFYAIYEDFEEDQDETNMLAATQGRKFGADSFSYSVGAQEVSIDAQYTQNSFRWYQNVNAQTPTTPWDLLEEGFADEGENIFGQAAINTGDDLRLRMNLAVGNATGTIGTTAMKLQYSAAETCSLGSNTWFDVGDIGSTTAAFSGYNNAGVVDGSTIATSTLASTTVSATYEEESPSEFLPNQVVPGDYVEYDWVVTSTAPTPNTNYCFRMTRVSGALLAGYDIYPEVVTSGPPEIPTLLVFFDNEHTATSTPVLEFVSTDATTDDIGYQVQVDNNIDFSSAEIDKNSITNFLQFENINNISDKSPFNNGDRIRFTALSSLATSTYYWRVRAIDPDGSNTYSDWSAPFSFTINSGVTVSEWFQTTGDQFSSDELSSLSTSSGAVSVVGSTGQLITSSIDFDDATTGNAWGSLSWNDTETVGTIKYQVQYNNNGTWDLIPNSEIPSNSLGNGTSPINLIGLDTTTYNEIRVVANFVGTSLSIQDITVSWGEKIKAPTLGDPFDHEKIADQTPTLTFVTSDPQADDLIYQVSYGTDATFVSSTTIETSTSTSGVQANYTVPGTLTDGQTYWWRVRARDPLGDNSFSDWSSADAFTIDTAITVSTWFQTTNDQFRTNTNFGLEAAGGSITITDEVGEYGTTDLSPGTWKIVNTLREYSDMVVVASPEYSGTTDDHRSPRVRNKTTNSFEIKVDDDDSSYSGTTTVDYIVMESGVSTLAGGAQVIAGTKSLVSAVQVAAYQNNNSELVTFSPAFSGAPIALATVSSDNDTSWVSTHIDNGSNSGNEVTTTGMGLSLGRQLTTGVHSPEDIDYIVFGAANGTNNSVAFKIFNSPNSVNCCNTGAAVTYPSAFSSAPAITVVHSNGSNGGDGTTVYKELETTSTNSTLYLQAGEIGPGSGTHTNEVVSVVAFESSSGIILRDNTGSLTGTMYSEPILFSDGAGPKFEDFSWNDTTPGASTLTYQVQYFNGTTWVLIPDVAIAGNSSGTSTSPIDLTGVNVATYSTVRLVANFTCSGVNCPSVDDWQVTWSEGVTLSGNAYEYDRTTVVNSGDTVRVAVNGSLLGNTGTISAGVWTINNVTAFPGDTVTVFVDGAAEGDEAVNVFVYDGVGDMTGVVLYEQHLTFNSGEKATTTNAALSAYDFSVSGDEDIFFEVDGANDLTICAQGTCAGASLYIGSGHVYIPDSTGSGNVRTHDFINNGRIELDTNTLRVSGSWKNNATVAIDTSTVIFNATTSTETIDGPASTATFYNVTFGETSGTATWTTADALIDVNNNLTVSQGTLSRNGKNITVAKNISTGANGFWSGLGNTTFDGTGLANWSDANAVKQNIGTTTLAGTGKTVTMTSSVRASAVTINPSNTLNGGGLYTLYVSSNFTNSGTFVPQTSTLVVDGSGVNATITTGASSLYSFVASTTNNGMISFANSTIGLLGNFTIATGTVNMPTTLMTVAGSFSNNGGYFAHNNGEVRMTGSGSKTVFANALSFYNNFYNLTFAGPATFSFVDTNATTTNNFSVTSGTVTLPSGELTVGADFTVSGSGVLNANNGKVTLLLQGPDTLSLNGSTLNDVDFIIPGGVAQVWYNSSWINRKAITIQSSQVSATLTDFPVFIDLSTLGADFWAAVKDDGSDIRVTAGDALTEMPVEVTGFSTTTKTGQLYFEANSVSSSVDTTFYIYYNNPAASAYATTATYGRNNVWANNYRAVYHFNEGGLAGRGNAGAYTDSTGNGFDATDETAATGITGRFGGGVEFDPANSTYGGTGIVDHVEIPYLVLDTLSEVTYSVWYQTSNTGVLHTLLSGARAAQSNDWLVWLNNDTSFQQFEDGTSVNVTVSAVADGNWSQYAVTRSVANGELGFFVDGVEDDTSPQTGSAPISAVDVDLNGLNIGLEQDNVGSGTQVNQELDGFVDEARFSGVIRTNDWIEAEFINQNTPATFYSTSTAEVAVDQTRTFTDVNSTITGDVYINAGQVTLPSGILSLGGSLNNDGNMVPNGGTIKFDSAADSETISFGVSYPNNLVFESAGGDWTIIDAATTTGAVTLTSAANFVLQSGEALVVGGQFTNAADGANTTWSGTSLTLAAGSDYAVNTKASTGDDYDVLNISGDGDVSIWNSEANTYNILDTSSLYSQDHAAVDGDLYIFGDYVRSTGTENWSYATDFDGTSLTGGGERQAFVFIESGATVFIGTSTLSMLGASGLETTVLSQSGSYALTLNLATLNAQHFTMAGTNANGLQLLASTTIGTFADGNFDIAGASTAITIDATTVNTNPARQIFGVDFNTVGGSTNVTLSGSPTSYLLFSAGIGDRYGEAFDIDDGNPGSIRWDDSTYGITVSGTVYSNDGVTPIGFPVCDDVSPVVRIIINGTDVAGGACSSVNSTYSISGVSFSGDPNMVVYLDNNRQPAQPAAVTLRSETTGSGTTNVTTGVFTVNKPATVSNGDLLVVVIGKDDSPAITAPTGWTTGDTLGSVAGNLMRSGIWYKRITNAASEPASYTFTGDNNEGFSYWIGSLVNVNPLSPQNVSFSGRTINSQNDTTPNATAMTTVGNGTYVLATSYIDNDNAVTAGGFPWATRAVNVFSSDNNNLVVSSRTMASPGVTGIYTVTGVAGGMESNNAQFGFSRVTYSATNAKGAVVSRTPTADISNMDIYQNRVITRHEGAAVLGISNMLAFDSDNDSDVPFTAVSGGPNTLSIAGGSGLYVWNNKTFTPNGNVTLNPRGNANFADGTLSIGNGATFTSQSAESHSIGGSFTLGTGATYVPSTALITMTATTTGKVISALGGATITVDDMVFNGGGQWGVTANLASQNDIQISSGTVNGTGNLTVETGSLYGNGTVAMTGGTTLIKKSNTFGGTSGWSFNNLTFGDGTTGTTSPAAVSTTTVLSVLTIAAGHYLDAGANTYSLQGTGNVFVENGTFLEDTSTVVYAGAGANVRSTAYYNLSLNSFSGSATYVAPTIGLLVNNDLIIGQSAGTSIFNVNTNDPTMVVGGDVLITANGTLSASNLQPLTVGGSWTNNGTFTANAGTVTFAVPSSANINPGISTFANLNIGGSGTVVVTNNATATVNMQISSSTTFTQNSGTVLAVGGVFTNNTDGTNTTWTGSTLSLYGGSQYEINTKTEQDSYATVVASGLTHPRLWNSSYSAVVTAASSSVYSMDHAGTVGDLYIFGDYINNSYSDYWSNGTDFDGTVLGSSRQADVYVEGGGSVTYEAGSLTVLGSTTASTTIQNQGSGTYALTVSGSATVDFQYFTPRDMDSDGLSFTGTPTVTGLDNVDFLIETNGASAVTVDGGVIDVNPALNFNKNAFSEDIGVTGAINVAVSGTSVSSWRFANEYGTRAGEAFDADSGDPGEIVWTNSAALITISGKVYSNEGSLASSFCDGLTSNVKLVVAGLTTVSTTCDGTGLYTFTNVGFGPSDSIIVYIDGEARKGATVTADPISNILNMDVYESRVIVRHESTDPIRITDLEVWDSDDDADVPFDAELGVPNTVVFDSDTKLIIWASKTFTPNGNVTVPGGGAGAALDGTIQAFSGAKYVAAGTETHTVGGSFILDSGATFTSASSSLVLTTTGAGRTVDINNGSVNDITFSGSGSWTMTDTSLTVFDDLTITNGTVTLPSATTTIFGSFDNSGGSFVNNSGVIKLASAQTGNVVALGGSDADDIVFSGSGSWTMTDVNATTTGSFAVNAGTVTLPSGVLTVGADFINTATIAHNNGTLNMTATAGTNSVTLDLNDLNTLYVTGAGDFTMTDGSASLLGDLFVSSGTLHTATNTLAIGGSLNALAGVLDTSSSTILFNSTDGGESVYPGINEFYNVVVGSASGGWVFDSATTTNNFTLSAASNFTLISGEVLAVGGVFSNNVADGNTVWTNTTLALNSGLDYTVNTKTVGDTYEKILLAAESNVRFWNSSFASTTLLAAASIYSQDNGNVAGSLGIYGDFIISTTTENWSYATDFDGIALGGSPRAVTVTFYGTSSAAFTMDSGALNIIGAVGATTTIQSNGTYRYPFEVAGGTLNASYYSFNDLDVNGLVLSNSALISNLANGAFVLAGNTSNLISLASTTLNANPSKIFSNVGFSAGGFTGGVNVELSGATSNAWKFSNGYGDLYGELFDADGIDDCGSIRFDDSSCLLVEQTHYRWRHDGGGLGVPDAEWYDTDWTRRMRVRVVNNDNVAYSTTSAKVIIPYDADMQTDFDDLRFTSTDGLTLLPYWIEEVVVATQATVWVSVPSLPVSGSTDLYTYYGNVATTTTSDGDAVFNAFDDFEDGNISEYGGNTSLFTVGGAFAFGGNNGLDTSGFEGSRATDGIYRLGSTVSQGEVVHYRQYIDTTAGSNDEVCTLFGVQSPGSSNNNYAVCIEQFGVDRMSIVKNAESTDSYGGVTILASTTVSYTTGWYEIFVDWRTDNTIEASLYNPSGTLVGTATANDSSYSSGGIGFTYWGQNGGWDSYFSYPRTATVPTTILGLEQTRGGADWVAPIDTPGNGFSLGDVARVRFAIENSGLDITDQEFQIEFAPKGVAPSCGSVSPASYIPVPSIATCGLTDLCLASSTHYTSGDATFDLLTDTTGLFTSGQAVEDPDNATSPFDVDSGYYTEVEYALQTTVNTTDDAYCFRVTDLGTDLDSYSSVAELTLQFDPVVSGITFNDGLNISLLPGTTTPIYATGTVTDLNGYADIVSATSTFYRGGVAGGATCSADNNNCYISSGPQCSFTNCSGITCDIECYADMYFHADPTDSGSPYDGQEWFAFIEAVDTGGGYSGATSIGQELSTLRAIDVAGQIDYGALAVNTDTGAYNASTSVENQGNVEIDVEVLGTDLSDGVGSSIPASQQKFATTTFTYSACGVACALLSSTTPVSLDVELGKPNTDTPPVSDDVFWGIALPPAGVSSSPHQGINVFTPISP